MRKYGMILFAACLIASAPGVAFGDLIDDADAGFAELALDIPACYNRFNDAAAVLFTNFGDRASLLARWNSITGPIDPDDEDAAGFYFDELYEYHYDAYDYYVAGYNAINTNAPYYYGIAIGEYNAFEPDYGAIVNTYIPDVYTALNDCHDNTVVIEEFNTPMSYWISELEKLCNKYGV